MLKQAKRRLGDRVSLRQANLERPLYFFEAESFDVIILALVLDSIWDWYPAFRELFRLSKPGGAVVFSVGHPLAEFDLSQSRNYFEIELIDGEWPTYGLSVPSYRRSFTEMFEPVRAAGFIIDRILEPLPTEECRGRFPESFRKLSTRPYFLHARLIKPDHRT
jgi:SAM-dependent methyltransferase